MNEDVEDLIPLAIETGYKAPLFRLPEAAEREAILPLIPLLSLTDTQMTVIDAALKVAGSAQQNICMLSDIAQSLNNSTANIRKHFKALIDIGLLREKKCTTDPLNRRLGSLFILQKPAHIHSNDSEVPSPSVQHIPLDHVDVVEPDSFSNIANSDLITSVLFGAFNYNRKSRESQIESNIIWRG
ncbi:MAG: hypothetical protein ACI8WB_006033, partial [Phenylobacterium sp.]